MAISQYSEDSRDLKGWIGSADTPRQTAEAIKPQDANFLRIYIPSHSKYQMLCPEVWNFKAPRHYFEIKRSSHTKENVPTTITNHYYNHSISIVLPNSNDISRLQNCIIDDSDYYKIKNIPTSQLINKEFIEAFVKKGELTLLSVDVKIDVDNCIAITPTGHLILSLTVEDYQKLGLEGKSSFFDRKVKSRYSKYKNSKVEKKAKYTSQN